MASALKDKLPSGFTRRPSGSLRVQIRVAGFTEVRNFALTSDTTADRRRQMAEAQAWATETRRRIIGGSHVSTREAERTTLAVALERYARDGLTGELCNADKDRARVKIILADPISRKTLAQLRKTDVAAFRDRLIDAAFLRKADRSARKLQASGGCGTPRHVALLSLSQLIKDAKASDGDVRAVLEQRIAAIAREEGIERPARSTIANTVQLISRSLKHVAQTIEGVPDLAGVPMPVATPGRERRIAEEELIKLEEAAGSDEMMPLIIRFAILTTLRRERLLSCRTSNLRNIGSGRLAIVFAKSSGKRRKRTGIVPVTKEIRALIDVALRSQGYDNLENAPDVTIFPITVQAFESRWKRLLVACDLSDLHFHDMRHEGTSRLFESGLSTAEVMSITGHSTQEMVDRYSHYGAALVLAKLEKGQDEAALFAEIAFLAGQFKACGGDPRRLATILEA